MVAPLRKVTIIGVCVVASPYPGCLIIGVVTKNVAGVIPEGGGVRFIAAHALVFVLCLKALSYTGGVGKGGECSQIRLLFPPPPPPTTH